MRLRDHRITGGNRGAEISTRHAVERERKVRRTKTNNRATKRYKRRTQSVFLVACDLAPRFIAQALCRCTQLKGHTVELNLGESGAERKRSFLVRNCSDASAIRVEPRRVILEKSSDFCTRSIGKRIDRIESRVSECLKICAR